MFKINDRVVVREYPTKTLINREGTVVGTSRLFVEVLLVDHKATLYFKEEELDPVD